MKPASEGENPTPMASPWLPALAAALLLAQVATFAEAQGNGKLQLHFIDVGQGDGAVLISPNGEVALFDNGVRNKCTPPIAYLQQLGVTQIHYLFTSHYHDDHIGCTAPVLADFPLVRDAIDRGGDYHTSTYQAYVQAVGSRRRTGTNGLTITLDSQTANPVQIVVKALNGNGISTTNENDLSLVATVHFGNFDAEIGGDLSGYETSSYHDIETGVAPLVGQVEVYKVHHHGSSHSSNDTWLESIKPRIGIISTGDGNPHGHPTIECLERLHNANIKTYWTETGNGASPDPSWDIISGNIIVEVSPGANQFTVTRTNDGQTDNYFLWGTTETVPTPAVPTYAWSKRSQVYHYATCRFVESISPGNLASGPASPPGKRLHEGCPR